MLAKILIRNIPSHVFGALETLANLHDRSTEAEARQAIQTWVEPALIQDSRNTRRRAVAERLNEMLIQVNVGRGYPKLNTSHIAELINEEKAEEVEDWFLGEKEPSFSQLTAIAKILGVQAEWLKHGDKTIYPVKNERFSENPYDAVNWLLSWDLGNSIPDKKVKVLHLIRSEHKTGNLFIVKESEEGHFLTYGTPIHISEEIGAGGEASLAAFFVTLELLYKKYTQLGSTIMVLGYIFPPDDITQLCSGNTSPASLLKEATRSMWWEDIWDGAMAPRNSYWTGWKSLYERIEKVISARDHLSNLRTQIKSGILEAKTNLNKQEKLQ